MSRKTGYRMLEGQALTRLAAIHLTVDQPDRAAHAASAALAIHRQTGHRPGETDTRRLLRYTNQQPVVPPDDEEPRVPCDVCEQDDHFIAGANPSEP